MRTEVKGPLRKEKMSIFKNLFIIFSEKSQNSKFNLRKSSYKKKDVIFFQWPNPLFVEPSSWTAPKVSEKGSAAVQ